MTSENETQREVEIPLELLGCTEQDLIDLGFTLGEPVENDPLFRRAVLPPGWSTTPHWLLGYWSYILDTEGRRRCGVFYKPERLVRRAHLEVLS